MSLRAELVNTLVGSLLGPQDGPEEILPSDRDPRGEYVCGVLSPQSASPPPRDPDTDAELPDGDVAGDDEDQQMEDSGAWTGASAPALDPKALPRSIGLTAVVESEQDPALRICVTFARYRQLDDRRWQREPHSFATGLFSPQDNERLNAQDEASILIRKTPVAGDASTSRISVFLTNSADPRTDPGDPFPTPSLLFQPQIRIALGPGTRAVSVRREEELADARRDNGDDGDPLLREEESLRLLYRERPVLARGHMCSAVWRDIDPENDIGPGQRSPFSWTDSGAVAAGDRASFQSPDLRTELIPLYPICAPDPDWRAEYGPPPVLAPAELAECWIPESVTEALQPLVDGYSNWISQRQSQLSALPSNLRRAGARHLDACVTTRERLQRAIHRLATDETIRLAFCFANRAMALQSSWKSGASIQWRPFQLAYILLCMESSADGSHSDRDWCDLLWFPTGGGKTEAYLGLIAFVLGLRRLRAAKDVDGHPVDTGLGVISRYTLRLLTVQQFRRALGLITACECLRVRPAGAGIRGWRPAACPGREDLIWGASRFSAGLWVGNSVTPNRFEDLRTASGPPLPGAMTALLRDGSGAGEPAQPLTCPCCGAYLAIPQPRHERQERPAFPQGTEGSLHFVFRAENPPALQAASLSDQRLAIRAASVTPLPATGFFILSVQFVAQAEGVSARDIDGWWETRVRPRLGTWGGIASTRPSRPGYFFRTYRIRGDRDKEYSFEVYCPAPRCPLGQDIAWREKVPVPEQAIRASSHVEYQRVVPPFQSSHDETVGTRIPIPATTVDELIYARPPSLLVATVDKFARLAFEVRAASLFGNVDNYHARCGYYRRGAPCGNGQGDHPGVPALSQQVASFPPPDLVLQDELHLIEGPLGSMVGLYETAIDELCSAGGPPKYIASTATVRQAAEQVQALFTRQLALFPPPGLSIDDNFFSRGREAHAAEDGPSGRLYVGIAAPGKGSQTPIVRIWTALLQAVKDARQATGPGGAGMVELDRFWTLVGYFNAIRELAGALSLYRQDIAQRLDHLAGTNRRQLQEAAELSSRVDSLQLPGTLSRLEAELPSDAVDAVLATSMFGTGVDISRLGLMVMHGQPKTSSAYIQATGRVGRTGGGLVVSFYRASRPRDLDHYEFFTGYHRQLYRSVEPVSVFPFSPRARERAIGPICVALLRQAATIQGQGVSREWIRSAPGAGCSRMQNSRSSAEVMAAQELLEERAQAQPDGRRPAVGRTRLEAGSELDVWRMLASIHQDLLYVEYALAADPRHPVVLGDAQHEHRQLDVAYENAPQSLRDVEATTGFKV